MEKTRLNWLCYSVSTWNHHLNTTCSKTSKLSIHKLKTYCAHFFQLVIKCNKASHCNMTHLSIWDGNTHINITDQFHKDYCILLLPLPFFPVHYHILVFSMVQWPSIHHYGLIILHGAGNGFLLNFFFNAILEKVVTLSL